MAHIVLEHKNVFHFLLNFLALLCTMIIISCMYWATYLNFSAGQVVEPLCKSIVDVGFILDSSGSLRNDYGKEKEFLKALAATFGVSDKGSRAGVVTFSYNAEHSIKLDDFFDFTSFGNAVDKIPLMGSLTRIDRSLRLAQKELFALGNGGRPGIPKLLILLTDGSQTLEAGAEDPAKIADELRASGIKTLVVGIGQGVNNTELARISGAQKNAFTADSFDELIESEFVNNIVTESCNVGKFANIRYQALANTVLIAPIVALCSQSVVRFLIMPKILRSVT